MVGICKSSQDPYKDEHLRWCFVGWLDKVSWLENLKLPILKTKHITCMVGTTVPQLSGLTQLGINRIWHRKALNMALLFSTYPLESTALLRWNLYKPGSRISLDCISVFWLMQSEAKHRQYSDHKGKLKWGSGPACKVRGTLGVQSVGPCTVIQTWAGFNSCDSIGRS